MLANIIATVWETVVTVLCYIAPVFLTSVYLMFILTRVEIAATLIPPVDFNTLGPAESARTSKPRFIDTVSALLVVPVSLVALVCLALPFSVSPSLLWALCFAGIIVGHGCAFLWVMDVHGEDMTSKLVDRGLDPEWKDPAWDMVRKVAEPVWEDGWVNVESYR